MSTRAQIQAHLDAMNQSIEAISPRVAATSRAHADRIRLHAALTGALAILDHWQPLDAETATMKNGIHHQILGGLETELTQPLGQTQGSFDL